MPCSSCGGSRVVTVTDASGQQQPAYVSKTRYVWQWIAADGSDTKIFDTEAEIYEFIKKGNPGTPQIVAASGL